jgi:hypothetical protein
MYTRAVFRNGRDAGRSEYSENGSTLKVIELLILQMFKKNIYKKKFSYFLNIPCLLVFFRATEGSTNKDD